MIAFFDACHIDMWDVVENGQYIPTNKDEAEIPKSSWNNDKKKNKVHSYKSSKEMWDTLALAYEGMLQVKDSKINHESIDQMFGRFQTIINNLRSLEKTYDNYDHITKILRSLPR
ncbi:hypothetical protein CR513_27553, partial [Mucuna pruriens]